MFMGMYKHSFSDYLLDHKYITSLQLVEGLRELRKNTKPSLPTAGIYTHEVVYSDIEEIIEDSKRTGLTMLELVKKRGLLSDEAIVQYKGHDFPVFVTFADILIKQGHLTYHQFQDALIAYESDTEIYQIELNIPLRTNTDDSIDFMMSHLNVSDHIVTRLYFRLFFNALYNNVSHDFTVLAPFRCDEYPSDYLVCQDVIYDNMTCTIAMDMEKDGFIEFAREYSKEAFLDLDEYVYAAIEDFINLHNGIFNVNLSNDYGVEATLSPPRRCIKDLYNPGVPTYLMAVVFPFGTMNVLVSTPPNEKPAPDREEFDFSQFLIK